MPTLTNVTIDTLRACIADPGAVLPRDRADADNRETIANWGARAILAKHAPDVGRLPDLVHRARNVLWSAENGGQNGRPADVRAMLGELCDEYERLHGAV